jgi:hypothetical protein
MSFANRLFDCSEQSNIDQVPNALEGGTWMKGFRHIAGVWLVILLSLVTVGCGLGGLAGSNDYPVKGKVTLADGKPLISGRVIFVSDETALSHGGTIAPDGSFELKQGSREGAPAGNYKVRVEIEESHLPKARKNSSNLPFPARYLDEDASKLTASVKPNGENFFEFKLTK